MGAPFALTKTNGTIDAFRNQGRGPKAWNEAGGGWEDAMMSRLLRELRARLSTALYLGLALGLVYFCLPKDVRPAVVRDRNYAEHDITLSLEEKANETWVEVISWSPRAFLVHKPLHGCRG